MAFFQTPGVRAGDSVVITGRSCIMQSDPFGVVGNRIACAAAGGCDLRDVLADVLFTGLTNDEMAKIIPLCCSDSQHLQSCQR
jgi:hypothetical protein